MTDTTRDKWVRMGKKRSQPDFTPAMRFTALPVVSFAAVVLFMIVKEILFLFREEM